MNQTNGGSKTEIVITGLSIEKVKEEEEKEKGIYTFKVVDSGKMAEPQKEEEMVLTTAENGILRENVIEASSGKVIKFANVEKVLANKQRKVKTKQQYKRQIERINKNIEDNSRAQ